ncbi:MAG TPA: sulfite exporter TauE/SafE family protein, partial [Draconibacterium sp.]|nr:sulfite exporter TauE/SafE family protein [Draconibacterium sp.]
MILALIGTGLAAGFINTNAGGGSMLTLPLLMFLGLPANVANGTNRIAILLQNVIAVNTFRQKKVLDIKTDYKLAIPAVIGSIIGALFAVEIDPLILKKIIAGLMVVLFLLVILKPEVWLKERAGQTIAKPTFLQYLIFFFIGFYGGFIQMGVGFFILAG